MVELFGEMPLDLLHIGQNSDRWFTAQGFYPLFDPSCSLIR
jgi:hypothetical protein